VANSVQLIISSNFVKLGPTLATSSLPQAACHRATLEPISLTAIALETCAHRVGSSSLGEPLGWRASHRLAPVESPSSPPSSPPGHLAPSRAAHSSDTLSLPPFAAWPSAPLRPIDHWGEPCFWVKFAHPKARRQCPASTNVLRHSTKLLSTGCNSTSSSSNATSQRAIGPTALHLGPKCASCRDDNDGNLR